MITSIINIIVTVIVRITLIGIGIAGRMTMIVIVVLRITIVQNGNRNLIQVLEPDLACIVWGSHD